MERILELLEKSIREGLPPIQKEGEIDYKLLQRTKKLFGVE